MLHWLECSKLVKFGDGIQILGRAVVTIVFGSHVTGFQSSAANMDNNFIFFLGTCCWICQCTSVEDPTSEGWRSISWLSLHSHSYWTCVFYYYFIFFAFISLILLFCFTMDCLP
ncbi:hypothetical protein VIGAN_05189200, partial [Vigna angularis var. angularis]